MEYIIAAEAAEKWGITVRQVQRLLAANRIPGTKQYGRSQLIPADAKKPGDPRFEKKQPEKPPSSNLAEIIAEASLSLPHDNPDAIFDIVKKERIRRIYKGELAYLRGDFEQTKQCYQKAEGDDMAKLRAASFAIAASISSGDYVFYQEIESFLKNIIKKDIDTNITMTAELGLASAYVSALAPTMVPDWLKNGDFAAFSIPLLKLDSTFKRVKYFQATKQYESMLATAQTVLGLIEAENGISVGDIYFRIACAVACCGLDRTDEAKRYLTDAACIYLPHGFITPFAEAVTTLGGLLERLLEREYPEYYDAVIEQGKRTFTNWLTFHNHFAKNNITLILSLRDYQIAQLAAKGVPNAKIAEQFHISEGRLKNKISEIYAELLVNNRNELAKLIL